MKRKLLLFALCLLGFQVMAGQRKGVTYYLYDSFEDATLTASQWTQDKKAGTVSWAIEDAAQSQYPSMAADSTHYMAFRGVSGKTQGAVTRLVTKQMNLSTGYQPILIFRHYQAVYTGDLDTLRVYFRTNQKSDWTLLKTCDQRTSAWKTDSIVLPNVSSSYQICFEGKDAAGRGIALDDIEIRESPTCDLPNTFATDSLTAHSAIVQWLGSFDTDSFHVVISSAKITDLTQIPVDSILVNEWLSDFQYRLTDLEANTEYYVYVHASCAESEAEWGSFSFSTQNLVEVPYSQSFNRAYAASTASHVANWTYGTSIMKTDGSMEFMPFVNQMTTEATRYYYSYDKTTCLVFTGARAISTAIPAGQYVYAATPELDVENVNALQVRCWGTSYLYYNTYSNTSYKNALLVGVMTNPDDVTTFTTVDTIYAAGSKTFDEYVISLANYQGTGKYVAFMSNFQDKPNVFYLDDVEISVRPEVSKGRVTEVRDVQPEHFVVDGKADGATAYNVLVVKDSLDPYLDVNEIPADLLVKQVNNIQLPDTIQLPEGLNGCFLQVYVQGVDGEWSLPKKVQIPTKWTTEILPNTITFDEGDTWNIYDVDNFNVNTTSYNYPWTTILRVQQGGGVPYIGTAYGEKDGTISTKGVLLSRVKVVNTDGTIRSEQVDGDYVALPALDSLQDLSVQFSAKAYSTTAPKAGALRVGVMTDPFDPKTFEEVTRVNLTTAFQSYQASLKSYQGQGRYIAIQAVDGEEPYKSSSTGYTTYRMSYNCLDNIIVAPLGDCAPAMTLEATVTDTSANLKWQGNGMSRWVVRVATNDSLNPVLRVDTVAVDSFHIGGLSPRTQYYWNVGTICEDTVVNSTSSSFKTECSPLGEVLPYKEDFEECTAGLTVGAIPDCWTSTHVTVSSSQYPYVYGSTTSSHTGTNSLYFGSGTSATYAQNMYLSLPRMQAPVNTLQIDFFMKGSSTTYKDTLLLGVMTDPEDTLSFQTVDTVFVNGSTYKEYFYTLDGYKGTGEYITLRKPASIHYYYLDDVTVEYIPSCRTIMTLSTRDANEHGASLVWTDPNGAGEFEVRTWKNDSILIEDKIVTTNPCVLYDESLYDINVEYQAQVRAICGEEDTANWSKLVVFRTQCAALDPEAAAEGFTDADRFSCWTVGAESGTYVPSRNVNGYLYMYSASTGDGLYAIMPALDVDSISHYQMSFLAHGGTSATAGHKLSVGVITNLSDFSTATMVNTFDLPQVTATTAATHYGFDQAQWYTVRFSDYTGDYNDDYGKNVIFYAQNGSILSYAYIDSISFSRITNCMEPVDLEADSVGANGAHIVWKGDSTATYQLQLWTDKMDAEGAVLALDTIVTGTELTVEGLQMLQKYYMYARQVQAADTSRWSSERSFETSCPPSMSLPYEENFDSYSPRTSAPYTEPNCWNAWYNGLDGTAANTFARIYASAKNGTTGNGYYMGSYMYKSTTATDTTFKDAYAVLPALDADLSNVMISFNAKVTTTTTSSNRIMTIGVADYNEPYDSVLNYTPLKTITITGSDFAPYSAQLNNYTGTGKYIVLHLHSGFGYKDTGVGISSSTTAYIYLDDIRVENLPTCFTPAMLTTEAKSKSEVKLNWTPQGLETAWEVAYVETGLPVDSATIVPADSNSVVVTGLNPSTTYDFYVRGNCEPDRSEWSSAATAQTMCLVDVENAHWDFEDHTEMGRVNHSTSDSYVNYTCWYEDNEAYKTSSTYVPYIYPLTTTAISATSAMYGYRSDYSLRLYSTTTNKPAWAALPELNADMDTLQVRFKATSAYLSNRKTGAYYNTYAKGSYPHSIKVGVMTDPTDISTFEQLAEYTFPEVTATKCTADTFAYWNEYTLPLYGATGKFIAFVSDYSTYTNYAFIDDVVVEKETGCSAPSKLAADSLTANSALLTWGSSKSKWNLIVMQAADTLVDTVLTDRKFLLTGLKGSTDYSFHVQAYCGDTALSDWTDLEFTTLCAAFDSTEAKWNFAENLVSYIPGQSTYTIPQCWSAGQLSKYSATTYTYMPQAYANTTTYQYGRNSGTTDRALRFYNYVSGTTKYTDAYAVLPELNVNYDSTALHFWFRAAYFYAPTYTTASYRNKLYTSNYNYPKQLVVGVLTDLTDPSSFRPVRTLNYTALNSSSTSVYTTDDKSGNDYWQEAVVPLKDFQGGRVVLAYSGEATGYMFIDDVDIVDAAFCTMPSDLQADSVTSVAARLSWSTLSDSVQLQVSTDENFKKLLVNQNVVDTTVYQLTDLKPATTYYFRLRSLCSEEDTSEWNVNDFTTSYQVRYHEDFSEVLTYPEGWNRYTKSVALVLDGAGVLPAPVSATTTTHWNRSANSVGMPAGHMIVDNYSTGRYYWLTTPTIDVPADQDSLMLTFDLSMTDGVNHDGGPADTTGVDDKFMVLVSQDAGTTWLSSDATLWSNDGTGQYVYNSIPSNYGGRKYWLDFSKYAGKQIKIAFYIESTVKNADNDLHLDNVQLNSYTQHSTEAMLCEYEDYQDDYFTISADNLKIGINRFAKYTASKNDTVADQLYTLQLTVNGASQVETQATICEGETYSQDGFDIEVPSTGDFKLKGTSLLTGCDSITTLHLTVLPRLYSQTVDSVKRGETYVWHEQSFDHAGTFVDTLKSLVTGCDSVCTLVLTYTTESGLNNLNYQSMSAMPNPVGAGQTFQILGEFGSKLSTLEIHSLTGALIRREVVLPVDHAVQVVAPVVPGAYMVTLKTENNQFFRTKVLVK